MNLKRFNPFILMVIIAFGYAIFVYNAIHLSEDSEFIYFPYLYYDFYLIFIFGIAILCVGYYAIKRLVKVSNSCLKLIALILCNVYVFLLLSRNYFSIDDFRIRMRNFCLVVIFFIALLILNYVREAIGREYIGRRVSALIIFIIALVVYVSFSTGVIFPKVPLLGDEPHYLLITHSIVYDGDIDVKNNYLNEDYRRYVDGKIRVQAVLGRGEGQKFYSIHMPAISIYVVPYYWLGQYVGRDGLLFLIRAGLSILGAIAAAVFYSLMVNEFDANVGLKTWVVFSLLPPVFYYSRQLYPEVAVLLLSMIAYKKYMKGDVVYAALIAGLFPFLGAKYLAISIGFLLLFLKDDYLNSSGRRLVKYIMWLVPVILYLCYLKYIYGYIVPTAQYQGKEGESKVVQLIKHYLIGLDWQDRIGSFFSYFLDQRDGLLPYVPIYLLAFLGMVVAYKKRRVQFYNLIIIAIPYLCLYSFLTHRGGYCPPARPLVAIIWVLGYFIGCYFAFNKNILFRKLEILLFTISVGILFYLLLNPLAAYQATTHNIIERSSDLVRAMSNIYVDLTWFFPSYLKSQEGYWVTNYFWILGIILMMAYYNKSWDSSVYVGIKWGKIVFVVMSVISVVHFSGVPQLSLRGMLCDGWGSEGARICFYKSRVTVNDGRNYHYVGRRPVFMMIESKNKLGFAEFKFNKSDDVAIKLSCFDKVVSPYSYLEKRNIRLLKSYSVGSLSYYLVKLEVLCKGNMCSYGFHVSLTKQ